MVYYRVTKLTLNLFCFTNQEMRKDIVLCYFLFSNYFLLWNVIKNNFYIKLVQVVGKMLNECMTQTKFIRWKNKCKGGHSQLELMPWLSLIWKFYRIFNICFRLLPILYPNGILTFEVKRKKYINPIRHALRFF